MKLRNYQEYAVDQLFKFFMENQEGNPVIAMPTGTGKSLVIAEVVRRIYEQWPTQRLMMLTHVKELIEQNADKVTSLAPNVPLGVFSAGLKKKVANYPVTFGGIQSCVNAWHLFGHIDLIMIDECHLVSPNANTSYRKFIDKLTEVNPNLRVIGLTATPFRLGLGMITDGGIFTDLCVDMTDMDSFNWFVDEGYLSPLVPMRTDTHLSVEGVAKRGGEFVAGQLQKAVNKAEITEAALREAIEACADRKRCLVFATGVEHAEDITDMLQAFGETAACVHSKQKGDRGKTLAAHQNGEFKWLVNNGVLTTGYDDPHIDAIIILRPTNSPGLWVQILGRGTRPLYAEWFDPRVHTTRDDRLRAIFDGMKHDCLVLDFARNCERLGPINDPQIPRKAGKGGGEPPIKICQDDNTLGKSGCGAYNHPSARVCCACHDEFIFKPKIKVNAGTTELIKKKKKEKPLVEEFAIDKIVYALHHKAGGQDSLKVTYHCGHKRFNEWVPAWHEGNIRHKGKAWWKDRTSEPLPDTAEAAVEIASGIRQPTHLRVQTNSQYPQVMGHVFNWEKADG